MAGSAAVIQAVSRSDRGRRPGRLALVPLIAAALAACSTGGGTPGAGNLSSADLVYRYPAPARPHFALAEMASLTSMSARQLTQRLGTPDFTRRDEPAEIWQYRSASCVLDVFLYPEDGGLKVVHATTRDRSRLGTPDNSCTPFPDQRSASAQ